MNEQEAQEEEEEDGDSAEAGEDGTPVEDALIDMCFVHKDVPSAHQGGATDAQEALEAAEIAVSAAEVATAEAQEENSSLRLRIHELEQELEKQRQANSRVRDEGQRAAPAGGTEAEAHQLNPRQYTARERLLRQNAEEAEAAAERAERLLVSARATLRLQHMAEVCPVPGAAVPLLAQVAQIDAYRVAAMMPFGRIL